MATFVLIHGGGDVGWSWHLVERALQGLGHRTVAPDLPGHDDTASLVDYADTVIEAIGDRRELIVVGHSYGGFTAPLVADRVPVEMLVLVAGMIPAPGESPAAWWENTGYHQAVAEQARIDGGLTGNDDPFVTFYHDVPQALVAEAMGHEGAESATAYNAPWPLDRWPAVPTRCIIGTEDRFFPPAFLRRLAADRLGVVPDEIAGGHCMTLSRPNELATMLHGYADEVAA